MTGYSIEPARPYALTGEELTEFSRVIHSEQRAKGFYDKGDMEGETFQSFLNVDQKLMLIVGEVAEAHEELRSNADHHYVYYRDDGKPEGFEFELADVLIRTLDLAGALGIDIGARVAEKLAYNKTRPVKHGRNF